MRRTLFLLLCFGIVGCAGASKSVKIPCPSDPVMLPVNVVGGTIRGKDLDHVIENHRSLWEHIHLLKKSGCKS